MFIPEKYDIKINIKNEKEVFRFIGMIVAHCLLCYVLFDMLDYIWNISLYKFCRIFFVYLTAIPSVIYCWKDRSKLKEQLLGVNFSGIVLGIALGIAYGIIILVIAKSTGAFALGVKYYTDVFNLIAYVVRVFLCTALVEEFVFRIAVYEGVMKLLGNKDWLAAILSAVIFGLAHIINGSWTQVIIVTGFGLVLGFFKMFVKKSCFLSLVVAHGTYNFFITNIDKIF